MNESLPGRGAQRLKIFAFSAQFISLFGSGAAMHDLHSADLTKIMRKTIGKEVGTRACCLAFLCR
jgi:hypothetical protein